MASYIIIMLITARFPIFLVDFLLGDLCFVWNGCIAARGYESVYHARHTAAGTVAAQLLTCISHRILPLAHKEISVVNTSTS